MALVSTRELLDHAAENRYGIPAFNVNNLEQVQAVMEAAKEVGAPVILQASAGARKYAGEAFIKHLILAAVDAIKVTLKVAPVGAIGTNYNPTYQWNRVSGATWYYLWVNGPSGTPLIQQWYQASVICSAGLCSATPSIPLGGGTHNWWIQTWNSAGFGPWSDVKTFTTDPLAIPGGVP